MGTWGQACGGEEKGATNLELLTILVACANIPDTLQFVKSNETRCNQEAGKPTFVIWKQGIVKLGEKRFLNIQILDLLEDKPVAKHTMNWKVTLKTQKWND